MISSKKLAQVLIQMASAPKADVKKVVTSFVKFLEENNLQALGPNIVRHLELQKEHIRQKNKFTITSPYKLKATAVNQILKNFKSENGAEVEKLVDDSLIGGVIVKHGGVMYDASIKTQLSKLQEILTS